MRRGESTCGSPRSANGTSITSKSRGTTVPGRSRAPPRRAPARSSASRHASARAGDVGVRATSAAWRRGRVQRLAGTRRAPRSANVASWTSTSALVRGLDDARGRRGVAGEHDLASGTRRAEHRVGRDHPPVGERDRLAALERPALAADRDAERVGGCGSKLPGRVAPRRARSRPRAAVVRTRRLDPVLVALERLARPERDELDGIGELPRSRPRSPKRSERPGGP